LVDIYKIKKATSQIFIYSVLFLLYPFFSYTQHTSLNATKDTINYNSYTGGSIDSLDLSFSNLSSSLPGGLSSNFPLTHLYDFFFFHEGGSLVRPNFQWKKMRFSAIPHLGFGTIFGNQATQIIHATYTHAFIDNTLLNIDYDKHQGNAFLRSSDFAHNKLHVQIERSANFYTFRIQTNYESDKIGHNGGIVSDSLLDFSPLAFIPTNKIDATSKYQKGNVLLNHFFNLSTQQDSSIAKGIYINNQANVSNRKYREIDSDLTQIYPLVLLSKDSTNDQFQVSNFINSLGVYFQNSKSFLKLGGQYRYWKYDNLGFFMRQSEINADVQTEFHSNNINFSQNANINLFGAKNEWTSSTNIQSTIKKWNLSAKALLSSLLPQVYQRNYHGNHLLYGQSFRNLKRQFRANINAEMLYKYNKTSIGVFAKTTILKDNYWFYNDIWRADTLNNIHSMSIGVKGSIHFKIFNFSVSGSYNIGDWLPDYLLQTRLFVQGKMFKDRKLLAQLGVELSTHSSYKLLEIIPLMDVYRFTDISANQRNNLHFFGAFEIQRFRFFFRMENIAYAWTAHTQQLAISYPIPARQLRVGITWDFFN